MPRPNAPSDFSMIAPASTPEPIIRRLSQAVIEGLRTPDLRERLQSLSVDPVGGTPEDFPAYLTAGSGKWRNVICARDIRVE